MTFSRSILSILLALSGVCALVGACADAGVVASDSTDSDSDNDSDSDSDSDTDTDTDTDNDSDADSDTDTDSDTDDPCEGVVCNMPPDAGCSGDNLVEYLDGGLCDQGVCDYDSVSTACPAGCSAAACVPAEEVLSFPSSSDTFSTTNNMWNAGDYVTGSRTTGLTSVGSADIHLVLADNVLSCDTQDVYVMLNGTTVGTMIITSGVSTVDASYTFAAIAGTTFTIRYQTASTVSSGCGSASYSTSGSTITLASP